MKSSMSFGTPLSKQFRTGKPGKDSSANAAERRHAKLGMSSAERSTDWNEPEMSDYLQQEILESSGGMWTAPWRAGLGQTVLG